MVRYMLNREMNNARWIVAVALLSCVVGGCGYATKRPFPEGVRSVHVEMFQSREFRRGIEFQLTEALRKRIEMETELQNRPRNAADSLLTGEIVEFRQAAFASDFRTDLPRELVGQLVVRFRWKDLRTGRILAENPALVQETSYVKSLDETEFEGISKAVEGLAKRIVEQMETSW